MDLHLASGDHAGTQACHPPTLKTSAFTALSTIRASPGES